MSMLYTWALSVLLLLFLREPARAQQDQPVWRTDPPTSHVVFGEQPENAWLVEHTHGSGGGPFGHNAAGPVLWYCPLHGLLTAQSLRASGANDPADVTLGRVPLTPSGTIDWNASLDSLSGTTVGQVGFQTWRAGNGLGAHFAMVEGQQLTGETGLLVLGLSSGRRGRTQFGSGFSSEDRLRRVVLFPDGHLNFDYEYDPSLPAIPHDMRALRVDGTSVLHGVETFQVSEQGDRVGVVCPLGSVVIGGGGGCDIGGVRASMPSGNGWEIVCEQKGLNRVYVLCARQ